MDLKRQREIELALAESVTLDPVRFVCVCSCVCVCVCVCEKHFDKNASPTSRLLGTELRSSAIVLDSLSDHVGVYMVPPTQENK